MMRISIIIPTYNSEKTIERALDSIIKQTFLAWEVIIVDGVPSDNTIEKIKAYADLEGRHFVGLQNETKAFMTHEQRNGHGKR